MDWIEQSSGPIPALSGAGCFTAQRGTCRIWAEATSAIYPYRTSILYTDSIHCWPWSASCWAGCCPLPVLRAVGAVLLCHAGAVWPRRSLPASAACARRIPKNRASVLGAGVLVLFPALGIHMFAHTALAANWLVLLALWVWLCAERSKIEPSTGKLCGGVCWGCCVQASICNICPWWVWCWWPPCAARAGKVQPRRRCAAIVSFCAVALAELFVLGAFAANFAGYSSGYLSGTDLANLFVPGLGASWEQEVYAGPGHHRGRRAGTGRFVGSTQKAVEFFRRHTHIGCRCCAAGAGRRRLDGQHRHLRGRTLFTVPIRRC